MSSKAIHISNKHSVCETSWCNCYPHLSTLRDFLSQMLSISSNIPSAKFGDHSSCPLKRFYSARLLVIKCYPFLKQTFCLRNFLVQLLSTSFQSARLLYIHGPLASEPQVAGVTRTGERPFGIPGFSPAGVTRRCGALRHSRV